MAQTMIESLENDGYYVAGYKNSIGTIFTITQTLNGIEFTIRAGTLREVYAKAKKLRACKWEEIPGYYKLFPNFLMGKISFLVMEKKNDIQNIL